MISFKTEPYAINGWIVARLTDDASKQLPSRGQVMAQGNINGKPFLSALEPDGNGGHWFTVESGMPAKAGEQASLEIEATKNWPEPKIPADWQTALEIDSNVKKQWDSITPMARWEWLRWIGCSANPDTRINHIQVSCSKLLRGERRPCCFNRSMCCVPEVSKSGVLLGPDKP